MPKRWKDHLIELKNELAILGGIGGPAEHCEIEHAVYVCPNPAPKQDAWWNSNSSSPLQHQIRVALVGGLLQVHVLTPRNCLVTEADFRGSLTAFRRQLRSHESLFRELPKQHFDGPQTNFPHVDPARDAVVAKWALLLHQTASGNSSIQAGTWVYLAKTPATEGAFRLIEESDLRTDDLPAAPLDLLHPSESTAASLAGFPPGMTFKFWLSKPLRHVSHYVALELTRGESSEGRVVKNRRRKPTSTLTRSGELDRKATIVTEILRRHHENGGETVDARVEPMTQQQIADAYPDWSEGEQITQSEISKAMKRTFNFWAKRTPGDHAVKWVADHAPAKLYKDLVKMELLTSFFGIVTGDGSTSNRERNGVSLERSPTRGQRRAGRTPGESDYSSHSDR